MSSPAAALQVLVVDDEPLARARLRSLLQECRNPLAAVAAEAGSATAAMDLLTRLRFDAALIDIHMPGASGMQLARQISALAAAPPFIFVTAHAEHALDAFELDAVDYLTKPVRRERLEAALQKAVRASQLRPAQRHVAAPQWLLVPERGRVQRVPLAEVIYIRSEQRYLSVRTASERYLIDDSLNRIEERFPGHFLRIHRNALVLPSAIRALVRHRDATEGEGWAVRLADVPELLMVSRRQLLSVRAALGQT